MLCVINADSPWGNVQILLPRHCGVKSLGTGTKALDIEGWGYFRGGFLRDFGIRDRIGRVTHPPRFLRYYQQFPSPRIIWQTITLKLKSACGTRPMSEFLPKVMSKLYDGR